MLSSITDPVELTYGLENSGRQRLHAHWCMDAVSRGVQYLMKRLPSRIASLLYLDKGNFRVGSKTAIANKISSFPLDCTYRKFECFRLKFGSWSGSTGVGVYSSLFVLLLMLCMNTRHPINTANTSKPKGHLKSMSGAPSGMLARIAYE